MATTMDPATTTVPGTTMERVVTAGTGPGRPVGTVPVEGVGTVPVEAVGTVIRTAMDPPRLSPAICGRSSRRS